MNTETIHLQVRKSVESLLEHIIEQFYTIHFNKGDPQHRFATALYASVLELSRDCFALINATRYAGLPILVRAVLEASVDLLALLKNPDYYHSMEAALWAQEAKICSNTLEHNIRISSGDQGLRADIEERMGLAKSKYAKLESQGYKRLKTIDRFVAAGKEHWYSPMYASLCAHSHHNIKVLVRRHFIVKGELDFDPIFEKECTAEDISTFAINLGLVLSDACNQVQQFFALPDHAQITAAAARFTALVGDLKKANK